MKNEHNNNSWPLRLPFLKMKNKFTCILLLMSLHFVMSGQEILNYIDIEYLTSDIIANEDDIKTDNGDYYVKIAGYNRHEVFIGSDTLHVMDLPDSLFSYDFMEKTIIAKFDEDLRFIRSAEVINAGFYYTHLAISEDRFFLSYNTFESNPNIVVNDSIILTNGDEGGIIEFDLDLNFLERKKISNNYINNMVASDTILYYEIELNEEYGYHVVEGDTIHNYLIEGNSGEPFYGFTTPLIIRYDYRRDKVESYWKFGSGAKERINSMALDKEENILLSGKTEAFFSFSLDGVTELETEGTFTGDSFIVKFDKYGNVI